MKDEVKITVVATGFAEREIRKMSESLNSNTRPSVNAPVYAPAEFIERPVAPITPPPVSSNPITRIAKKVAKKPMIEEMPVSGGEDDLEIPAFIRKKMK
jgi:hypothetical protein